MKRGAATDPSAQGTLPEAPTFRPTAAEFTHPLRYILSIRAEAEKFGICAIVPPAGWKPPFCIDRNRLKFPARVQRINELMVRKVQRLRFLQELSAFWDGRGAPLSKTPTVGGRPLDLHLLHATVRSLGGYEATCAQRLWPRVAEAVHLDCSASHASSVAKRHYEQTLLPFDQARKEGQLQGGEGLGQGGAGPRAAGQMPAGGAQPGAAAGPSGVGGLACNGHAVAATSVSAAAAAGSAVGGPTPTTAEDGGPGGGLLSRRGGGATLVKLCEERETSNAGMYEEDVIAYEPPEPGKEVCEVCGSGDNDERMILCDR
jgi:histone demethylase JARID1